MSTRGDRAGVARADWSAPATDGTQRGEAFASLGLTVTEPRSRLFRTWAWTHLAAGQHSGLDASLAELGGGFTLGRRWQLGTQYTLGMARGVPFTLGGVVSGIRDEPAQWRSIQNGWLLRGQARGTVHDRMEVAFGSRGIEAYGERRRFWTALGMEPYSLVGFRVQQSEERQSLVKIPGVTIEIGLGCALEQRALLDRPCTKLDDYRSWSQVTWRP